MAAIERAQYKSDPMLALETAYQIASTFGPDSIGSEHGLDAGSARSEHSITYRLFFEDTGELHCAVTDDYSDVTWELDETDENFGGLAHGEKPGQRRVTITWGDGPFITIKAVFDKSFCYRPYKFQLERYGWERTFVPSEYRGQVLPQYRISLDHLKEWWRRFVAADPRPVRDEPDLTFVAGDDVATQLANELVGYVNSLPLHGVVTQEHLFTPSYVYELLDIDPGFYRTVENIVCNKGGPLVRVWGKPPEERSSGTRGPFKPGYRYVLGHPRYWVYDQTYDWSSHYYRGADPLHTGKLWIA